MPIVILFVQLQRPKPPNFRRPESVTTGGSMNRQLRRTVRGLPVYLLVALTGMCEICYAQSPPVITSLSPPSISSGGPNFTLAVTGSNFQINSVVQVNGTNRPT